jgi:hypothetical protein
MSTRITPQISDFSTKPLRVSSIVFTDSSVLSTSNFDFNFVNHINSSTITSPVNRTIVTPKNTNENVDLVLEPKGSGGILRSSNGDKRGEYSVDLQKNTQTTRVTEGNNSVITGGTNNYVKGDNSVVCGGVSNTVYSDNSNIAGGVNNNVNGLFSSINGGVDNNVIGDYSSINSGINNRITNNNSSILGGNNNLINKQNCYILGNNITTTEENYTYVDNLSAKDLISTKAIRFEDGTTQITAWLGTNNSVGFTPVQQGGGEGQGLNKIYIGYGGSKLKLQIDNINYSDTWPISILGNASTSTIASTANVALSALDYLHKSGGIVNGTTEFNNLIVKDSIAFNDGTVLSTSPRIQTTLDILGQQKGSEGYICASTTDKRVLLWGKSEWFNNGVGVWPPQNIPFEGNYLFNNNSTIKKIICGKNTVLVLLEDGTLWHCGNRKINNTVTSGTSQYSRIFKRILLNNDVNALIRDIDFVELGSVNISQFIVCVITNTNDLYIWGTNNSGCCGVQTNNQVSTPVKVNQFNSNVKQVSIKLTERDAIYIGNVSVITTNNQLWSAGCGKYYNLTNNLTSDSNIFVRARTNSTQFLQAVEIFDTGFNHIENFFIKGYDVLDNERLYVSGKNTYNTITNNKDNIYFEVVDDVYEPLEVKILCFVSTRSVFVIAKTGVYDESEYNLFNWGRILSGNTTSNNPIILDVVKPVKLTASVNRHEQNTLLIHTQDYKTYSIGTYSPGTFETSTTSSIVEINGDRAVDSVIICNSNGVNSVLTKTIHNDIFLTVLNGAYITSSENNINSLPIKITNYL